MASSIIEISSDDSDTATEESDVKEHNAWIRGSDKKRRKIHMKEADISTYNKTESGGMPLMNPNRMKKSSQDPNKGLYPRPNKKAMPAGFQRASAVLNPRLPFVPVNSPSKSSACSSFQNQSGKYTQELSNSPTSSPSKLRSVMRSPIKQSQLGSILHYCVSSLSSSQNSLTDCSQSSLSPMDSQSIPSQMPSATTTSSQHFSSALRSEGGNSSDQNKGISTTQRLCEAQRQMVPNKNIVRKAKEKTSLVKTVTKQSFVPKKDNTFLYPDPDKVDPLSMGVKPKAVVVDSDSDSSTEDGSYFDILPTEIIENIFCRLPFLDLHLNLTRVCSQWNEIISDSKFIPWKKKYYRIKMNPSAPEIRSVYSEMQENNMTRVDYYLTGLIKYMVGYKRSDLKVSGSLHKHKKYTWALELLKERLPECMTNETANPWSLITTLCLIADSVSDITEVIECLLAGDTYIMAVDVVECLYCVATFLLCFKTLKYQDVWTCMHYKVYYALYLFENEGVSMSSQLSDVFKHGGQQSLLKYGANKEVQMTREQMHIVKYDAQPGDIAKIVAFAGTGKTTTLVKYTTLRPNKRFLLVVFNTSVREQANKIFPPNVTCKTGHSLAFGPVGSRYKNKDNGKEPYDKKKFNNSGLKIGTVLNLINTRKGISIYIQAKFVIDTLNRFMCSADDFITVAHVPSRMMADDGQPKEIDHEEQLKISSDAHKVWQRMVDLNDVEAPMVHDGYLKIYQLRKPTLYGYDVILIDEAQDLTPAVNDILTTQKIPKIFVGDPHQQIYAFRGAVNAMNLVQATHTFYLTQSFRFGPEIAFVASSALEFLKGEKKRTLVGNGKDSSISGDVVGQLAIITRTNFNLFSEAVKKCCYKNDEKIKVAFAGGADGFGFPMIKSIYALMIPQDERKPHHVKDLKSSYVGKFRDLGDLEKYATKTMDNELLGKIKIVKTYTHGLPSLIDKILQKTVSIPEHADVIFSTAHKAKGLEFSTVRVTDDFNVTPHPVLSQQYKSNMPREDEANLLYVAVTRAKKRLIITQTIVQLLDVSGERFLYPELSEKLKKEGSLFKCFLTDTEFTPHALTLRKREIMLSGGSKNPGGLLCPQVVLEEIGSLKQLYGAVTNQRSARDQEEGEDRVEGENREGWNFGLFADLNEVDLYQAGVRMGIVIP